MLGTSYVTLGESRTSQGSDCSSGRRHGQPREVRAVRRPWASCTELDGV